MNELLPIENINAAEIYKGEAMNDLLIKIKEEATSVIPDIETDKGRKAIASVAAKVAKSKTFLDSVGKDLVSDWKTKAKAVDAKRKEMRDFLDDLKTEVRKPLTDWENIEKARMEKHEANITEMTVGGTYTLENWLEIPLEAMKDRLKEIEGEDIEAYEEYSERASDAQEAAASRIKKAINKREAHESEQAELERLRKEAADREQKDREERIAKEASEKAEKEKQAAVEAQKAAELRAKQVEEDAKQAAIDAEKEAKARAEQAAKAERDRLEQEKKAEEIATKKREADQEHKSKVNNTALKAFVKSGLSEDIAKKAVTAIAKGKIPAVSIAY